MAGDDKEALLRLADFMVEDIMAMSDAELMAEAFEDAAGCVMSKAIDLSPEALQSLPTLSELQVPLEILEAAEAYCASPDTPGFERGPLEVLVRMIAYHLRESWKEKCVL